jgi:hypothetical protein
MPSRRGAAVDVLNHGVARKIGQRLPGKSRRPVPGRDDNDSMFVIMGTIADAFEATCGTHVE